MRRREGGKEECQRRVEGIRRLAAPDARRKKEAMTAVTSS